MIRFVSIALSVVALSLVGIALFVGLFYIGAGRETFPILMYRGLFLALLAATIQFALLIIVFKGHASREYLIISAISLALASNVIFLVVFPVTIDRSVSVYLLGQLASKPSGMTEDELSEQLINQYVREYRGVDRRMVEQIISGNVKLEGDRYLLTKQGWKFITFSDVVARIFGVDTRYLRPSGAGTGQPR